MSTAVKEVSPLEASSPGDPERSVDSNANRILLENCVWCLLVVPILCAYTLMEWLRWYRPLPPPPWSASVVALITLAYSVCKLLTTRHNRKSLR
jgi:hypothetical protein